MSKEEQVRVTTVAEEPTGEHDYSSILNENLRLLRRVELLSKSLEDATKDKEHALLNQKATEDRLKYLEEKLKLPPGYRATRRRLVWLNILVALVILFAPSICYFKYHMDPTVPSIGLIGMFWMIGTVRWADILAERERQSS